MKAHWIRPIGAQTSSYKYKCSECGSICHQVTGNCGRKQKEAFPACTYLYCPFCGAKMDGEMTVETIAEITQRMLKK